MTETPNGRFCWGELLTTDPEAAADFYAAVIGWGTREWEGSETPYAVWMNGEMPVGGFMRLPPEVAATGAPPHWLVYVSTPDVEACAVKAQNLGGHLLNQFDIPDVGRMAIIADPQGAVITAYQPSDATPGHDGPASIGEFSWHELATTDWEAAWAFYSELFGWREASRADMGEAGIYLEFHRGAHPLGGIFNRPPEMPVSAWLPYIRVPDAQVTAERVAERGGTVLNGPMEVPGGDLIAQCKDPQGAIFAFHATTAE